MTDTFADESVTASDLLTGPVRGGTVATVDVQAVNAITRDQTWWTPRQLAVIRAMGVKNASDEELLLFLHYCQKTGLDPFSKQIYMIERRTWNKSAKEWEYTQTIQVGIDGFRVNAQRAAHRMGVQIEYMPTVWFAQDGSRHEVWLDNDTPPAAALVTVVKVTPEGLRLPVPGLAKFESYAAYGVKKDRETGDVIDRWLQSQWAVMPDHMIEKCAEAFALRRAFPNDLGGLYIEEELQAQNGRISKPPVMPTYSREVQAEDGSVIEGKAEPVTAPEDEPVLVPPTRDESRVHIAARFREIGLGAKNHAAVRRAVLTGVLTPQEQDLTAYVNPDELSEAEYAGAANELSAWLSALTDNDDGTVKEQVIAYAEGVRHAIETSQRTADGEDG